MGKKRRRRAPQTEWTKGLPRVVEVLLALFALIISAPIVLIAMGAVAVNSKGPVIFRQDRVGKNGRIFTLFKIRTMRPDAFGVQITVADDPRITPLGRILRQMKIDELPGFWNVLTGDLCLVGPRPEVPRYVEPGNTLWDRVLSVRPGLTDPVTVRLRNEERLLNRVAGDREQFYREKLLPFKLRGYLKYQEQRTAWSDLRILGQTLLVVFRPQQVPSPDLNDLVRENP